MSFSSFTIRRALPPVLYAHNAATTRRTMATNRPKEWLCIMPDKPNVTSLRKATMEAHYNSLGPLIKTSKLVAGGAILHAHPGEGEDAQIRGSAVIYTGETESEVRNTIGNDPYARAGVWDLDRVQVIPYISAVREPLSK